MADDNQQQQNQQVAPEWLKPFGDGAKAFGAVKEPADLVKAWTDTTSELTTLKAKPATFDFRKELGGEDEAAKKFLERFADSKTLMKSVLEAQNKLRSGDFAKPLPKDATPEQVKEWRTANGVPLEPKGYFAQLPDGLVIGKEDQSLFDAYAKVWHDHNLPPASVHAMTKMYYDGLAQTKKEEAAVDKSDSLKTIGELRTKWGGSYDQNMAILDNFLEGMPGDLKARFKDATLPDGTRLFNDSDALEFFANAARAANPAGHLLPAGGEGNIKSLDTEIESIQKLMRTDRKKYNGDEKLQARYRELLTAKQKLGARAA